VVVANSGSVGASLIVWSLSGLLGWTGASSFAELGSAIPLSGGAQAYLAYSYGPLVSYLFAWTAISALKPGTIPYPPHLMERLNLLRLRGQRCCQPHIRGISQQTALAYDSQRCFTERHSAMGHSGHSDCGCLNSYLCVCNHPRFRN
jgi:Amino acid permease